MSFKRKERVLVPQKWLIVVFCCVACAICFNMVVLTLMSPAIENSGIRTIPMSRRRMKGPLPPPGAVHFVTTRFMQHQPSLLHLGYARLELFKTICLPTMLHQDTSDYLWLILIDPNLHPLLMNKMKVLIESHPNVFIIRCKTSNVDFQTLKPSMVETGDYWLLVRAINALNTSIVVETRLDADDGLARPMLQAIRGLAVQQLSAASNYSFNGGGWVAYCIHRHFEWHVSLDYNNDTATLTNGEAGNLILVKKLHCVTPGLTFARAPGVSHNALPGTHHQWLELSTAHCSATSQTGCVHRFSEIAEPVAIRARTPTSAGMSEIGRDYDHNKSNYPIFWTYLEDNFNIQRRSLVNTQRYLKQHVVEIAKDNLDGQCTKGHSCKSESRKMLSSLLK